MTNTAGDFAGIDERKLERMKCEILDAERINNNTKALTRDKMVDLLLQTIKNVANRAY